MAEEVSVRIEESVNCNAESRNCSEDSTVSAISVGNNPLGEERDKQKKLKGIRLQIPYAIVGISLLQIVFYYAIKPGGAISYMKCDPFKSYEIWRFFTYTFIHPARSDVDKEGGLINNEDLWKNIAIQIIFGVLLETELKSSPKTFFVYLVGAVGSALGTQVFKPCSSLVGGSGAVSGLIMATVAGHIMKWTSTSRWRRAIIWIGSAFFICQIFSWMFHKENDLNIGIGEYIPLFGGMGGFLARGILREKQEEKPSHQTWMRNVCMIMIMILMIFAVSMRIYYAVTFYGVAHLEYIHGTKIVFPRNGWNSDQVLQALQDNCRN